MNTFLLWYSQPMIYLKSQLSLFTSCDMLWHFHSDKRPQKFTFGWVSHVC